MSLVTDTVAQNRAGRAVALASVCSAQPDVLSAALLLAKSRNRPILVEATSNQVNQFGGYTGMTPDAFIAYVRDMARDLGVDPALVVFGGDHLGPQVWRSQDAETAMTHARALMRAYVEAGFTKIHLDCSEGCAGEPAQVGDAVSAARAAELAAVCEAHAPDPSQLCYIVGTEVPPPGGARVEEAGQTIAPTRPEHARHTLERHHVAFQALGLEAAWARVVGLVVQPGLEFAPTHIDRFDMAAPDHLSAALADWPGIAFEAHSTDYQHDPVYPELARRHFAVHKVGPALTFAYRQALYALDGLSAWLDSTRSGSDVSDAMERQMLDNPVHWQKHYDGDAEALRLQRHFGYADRIRYYWPEPHAQTAVAGLFAALDRPVPAPLVQQYFAHSVAARAESLEADAGGWARALVWAQIQEALAPYLFEAD
ncbi:class II D-tagatose-bisphosphate aldolase non-catalytic subunit [Oceanibium sediminis]|uniref:class II D-tagatose-bisphosphate aldolase non-catalytic subunit n=1 Tax=Oceanibium sediminis TaxID=2026339 RepID=UPI000DD334BA|nr:class II D-tagatose-bisphosphate aldolase, non-catalytic subunit [Oceanibium sediminis]